MTKTIRNYGYGLDDRGSIPGGGGNFSLLHRVHTDSEAHPASYQMGTGGKEAEAWSQLLTSF
jgi:hypothetical protein